MKAIGFRAEKDTIHYAIVEGTAKEPRLIGDDKFSAPKTYTEAQALSCYRDYVRNLIERHHPNAIGVRYAETFLPKKPKPDALASMFARARIEGVIVEVGASMSVGVFAGRLQQMSSQLDSKRAKAYLESGEFRGLDLSSKSEKCQEAFLVGVAALEI